jgi:hypothetical protein
MNARFQAGVPSNNLAEAGVLLRQIDALNDAHSPWRPCPKGQWCANLGDRWASSIVNTFARKLYLYDKGGMVLAPTAKLFCACPEDCNSQDKVCDTLGGDEDCTPGCFGKDHQCTPGGQAYECSFPPHQLADALRAQEATDSFRGRNNEMVLDVRSIVHGLPNTILGFFFLSTHPEGLRDMRSVQKRFISAYHLTPDTAPPLVALNFGGSGGAIDTDAPFELVPWGIDED